MSYNVSFISLGCAKNQVNCEQMMALCAEAGYSIQAQPEGCDVVVVNTCGFLSSACEEAIDVCRKNIHPWAPGHMGATGKTLTQMLDDK